MRTACLLLSIFLATPAFGNSFMTGDENVPSIPWPQSPLEAADCNSNQGAVVNAQLGIPGSFGPQGACLTGANGQPGNLIGFAFPVSSCQDGFVKTTRVQFNQAEVGDQWRLYLWRDSGGLPLDACGLECGVANNPLTIPVPGPTVQSYDWITAQCPCLVFQGERLHIGVVYVNGPGPQSFDWAVGRNSFPSGAGFAFGNLNGVHGNWQDLNSFGFGNKWGVENQIGPECGVVPVDASTWGQVKSLYR